MNDNAPSMMSISFQYSIARKSITTLAMMANKIVPINKDPASSGVRIHFSNSESSLLIFTSTLRTLAFYCILLLESLGVLSLVFQDEKTFLP